MYHNISNVRYDSDDDKIFMRPMTKVSPKDG